MLVDDHALFRLGLKNFLNGQNLNLEVIGEADSGKEALARWQELQPELVILDVELGDGMNGLEVAKHIKATDPNVRIIILTVSENIDDMLDASRIGVEGYLIKKIDPQEFLECINSAIKGNTYVCKEIATRMFTGLYKLPRRTDSPYNLTKRELEIIELVTKGQTNNEIARNLFISISTVKKNLSSVMEKMGVKNRTEVASLAISLFKNRLTLAANRN
jgi:two-component system NarL family response regulator